MNSRYVRILALFLALSLFIPSIVRAEVDTSNPEYQSKLKEIQALKDKISQAQGEAKTLSSAINYLSNKKALTQKQIDATQFQITLLNHDVTTLSGKITSLEGALDAHVHALITDVQVSYKTPEINPFQLVLSSSSFTNYQTRARYLELATAQHSQILKKATEVKMDYDSQKAEKENKQKQVALLQTKLNAQQKDLVLQEQAKQRLLQDTKNSESNYQKLLSQAQEQLASFSRFAAAAGGSSLLSNQTSCDDWGCYYNQRDSTWGALSLNGTKYSIASDGCLVTSMAMILTHYGHKNVTPMTVNSNSNNFASYYPAYLLYTIFVDGVSATRVNAAIDSTLSTGNPVVVGLRAYGGTHFVVLKSGSNGKYVMRDPYIPNGKDIAFTDHYAVRNIYEIHKVVIN